MRKRRDLEYAKICLEEWAKYMEDTNGFPSRSPTDKYGELKAHRAESSLPNNIESHSREVDFAIQVLGLMRNSNLKSSGYADVLKEVSRNRCNDESIIQALERLELDRSERYYYAALDEFAAMLDVVIFFKKEEYSTGIAKVNQSSENNNVLEN